MEPGTLLDRKEASRYLKERWQLRYSPATLAKLAVQGGGPKFVRHGVRVLYPVEYLDQWAQAKIDGPFSSTSEYPTDFVEPMSRADEAPFTGDDDE